MTKEEREIIFEHVISTENSLLTAIRKGNPYDSQADIYHALWAIVTKLGLETEYSDWKFNGEE